MTDVLRRPLKNHELVKFLTGLLVFTAFLTTVQAQANVTLAWNPSSDPLVAGYNIYYGGISGVYTNKTSVGTATSLTISNLVNGNTYYFAATTYDAAGAESAFSSQVAYTVPTPPAGVQLLVTAAKQFVLTVTGPAGHTYDIQATQNFKTWTVIGTVTVGAGGSLNFTDPNAAVFSRRFYRTHDISSITPRVQLLVTAAKQFMLTVTGPAGHTYDVLATQDFKTWTVIGTVTVGAGGSLNFTDPNAANFSRRFYRTHDTSP